eukprot:11217971-Lingulodinium_polyedra.AAC.1
MCHLRPPPRPSWATSPPRPGRRKPLTPATRQGSVPRCPQQQAQTGCAPWPAAKRRTSAGD